MWLIPKVAWHRRGRRSRDLSGRLGYYIIDCLVRNVSVSVAATPSRGAELVRVTSAR